MRHELDIDELTPQKLRSYFKEQKLRAGDELKLKSSREKGKAIAAMIYLLAWILLYVLKRYSDQKEGEKRLQDLFQRTSAEELETLMQEEYGIKMSFEQKEGGEDRFREEMYELSEKGLGRAWDEDEPDISDIPVQEPNPNYRPEKWRKDRS
jgi:hypothetical protein